MEPIMEEVTNLERELENFSPFYILVDDISRMLFHAAEARHQSTLLSLPQCEQLLKALAIFVSTNPASFCSNLFSGSQRPSKIFTSHIHQKFPPNWHSVLEIMGVGTISTLTFSQQSAIQRSNAVELGRIMSTYNEVAHPHRHIALIIAFWIAKLYMACEVDMTWFPTPLRISYEQFLYWKGHEWDSLRPCLRFNDPFFTSRGVHLLNLVKAVKQTEIHTSRTNLSFMIRHSSLLINEAEFRRFLSLAVVNSTKTGVFLERGKDASTCFPVDLAQSYLFSDFDGTLEEFRSLTYCQMDQSTGSSDVNGNVNSTQNDLLSPSPINLSPTVQLPTATVTSLIATKPEIRQVKRIRLN